MSAGDTVKRNYVRIAILLLLLILIVGGIVAAFVFFFGKKEGYYLDRSYLPCAEKILCSNQANRQLLMPYIIAARPQLLYPPYRTYSIADRCLCKM